MKLQIHLKRFNPVARSVILLVIAGCLSVGCEDDSGSNESTDLVNGKGETLTSVLNAIADRNSAESAPRSAPTTSASNDSSSTPNSSNNDNSPSTPQTTPAPAAAASTSSEADAAAARELELERSHAAALSGPPTLRISNRCGDGLNGPYDIALDGKVLGTFQVGGRVETSTTAGTHTITVTSGLGTASQTVTLVQGQVAFINIECP